MNTTNKRKVLTFILGFFFIAAFLLRSNPTTSKFNFNSIVEKNDEVDHEISTPEVAWYNNTENPIYIDASATGVGAQNWTWALSQDWCTIINGIHVIENVTIDATGSPTGSGIYIKNSKSVYFRIQNCTIFNSGAGIIDAGIRLENTSNGTIINNTVSNNQQGILLYNNCDKNNITENTANENKDGGIYLRDWCDYNIILNNTVNDNKGVGIMILAYDIGRSSDHNDVLNNTANNCTVGIWISASDSNTISGNILTNHQGKAYASGIRVSYNTGGRSNDNTIINNEIISCHYGISLIEASTNTISKNMIQDNTLDGIYFYNGCNGNTITNNTASGNDGSGIYFYIGCNGNTITNNTASGNTQQGIYLNNNCDGNTIATNNVSGNNGCGIYLNNICDGNSIANNTASGNNGHGIYLSNNCDGNTIANNTASGNNGFGIYLYHNCDSNTISNNTASDNTQHGIYFNSVCNSNTISNNTASGNTQHGIYFYNGCNGNTIANNTASDNTQHGIFLYLMCDLNFIKNNTIERNNLGIGLYYSSSNTVAGNVLKNNGLCILERGSTGNTIEYNDCSGSTKLRPIFINGTATGVGALNWTWALAQGWCTGSGTKALPYIIQDLIISGFGMVSCIEIINSDKDFIVKNCTVYNSGSLGGEAGIRLENVTNGTLTNNTCSFNEGVGIRLYNDCNFNNLTGNDASNNDDTGIYLEDNCDNNTITGNDAINNGYYGIYLEDDCDNNTITGNNASNNDDTGIYLDYECDNNTITGNDASDNDYCGIYLDDECDNNTITGNNASDNYYGIQIYDECDNNTITGNNASNNDDTGIYLDYSNNNTIVGNIISNNIGIGLSIYGEDEYGNGNLIYLNYFYGNGLHASDDGLYNRWDNGAIGNYWDNYTGVDANNDGIGDTPYTFIGGSAGAVDRYPIWNDLTYEFIMAFKAAMGEAMAREAAKAVLEALERAAEEGELPQGENLNFVYILVALIGVSGVSVILLAILLKKRIKD